MLESKAILVRAIALLAFILLPLLVVPTHAGAAVSAPQAFDISPQSLATALSEFARQSQRELLFTPELVAKKTTTGVRGNLEPLDALAALLKNTGIDFSMTPNGAILLRNKNSIAATEVIHLAQSESSENSNNQNDPGNENNREASSSDETSHRIEEIIVTAQKRSERLQDVPVPVTAIDAESLVATNQLQIQEYYTKIPGLSLTLLGDSGTPSATIRGVTTGTGTTPTVGIVVDDVAFGTSTVQGLGIFVPDFDPSELARIEVLRGPQGTLYGANSMGGLLKFVTVDPSTDEFSGRVQLGTTSIKNGDGIGYSARGSVNLPLGETFAIRASGATRRDPGYVDDPSRNVEGVNQTDSTSGRIATLWQPSDAVSLKLSALVQDTERDGESYVFRQPGLEDLQHTALPGTGWYEYELQAYSATLVAALGRAELTSVSGYSVTDYFTNIDATLSPVVSSRTQTRFGVPGASNPQHYTTKKFSQEVRLSIPLGERIEWLMGAFYADESYLQRSEILANDPASGATVGSWFIARRPSAFDERAVFTNLTFDITDQFDIQVGGRASEIELATGKGDTFGPWNIVTLGQSSLAVSTPEFVSEDTAFTYLVTPRLKISADLMVYARLASGYRPGGPNTSAIARNLGLPLEYSADTTQNYELGLKGSVLDRKLSFDASLYYIDWKDIQIQLRDAGSFQVYLFNSGKAKSQGVELSVESHVTEGLTIGAWGAWNDAELTEPFPSGSTATGRSGDRLPYSAPWSGSLSIDQEFALPASRVTAFVGISGRYVGDRKGSFFAGPAPRQMFPAYTQVDLHGGARFDSWTINAYVNNVGDKRGVLRSGRDAVFGLPYIFTYIQPRTAGLSITKTF